MECAVKKLRANANVIVVQEECVRSAYQLVIDAPYQLAESAHPLAIKPVEITYCVTIV